MNTCPDIDDLLVAAAAQGEAARAHLDACAACAAVAALASSRSAARAPSYPAEACAELEPAIAAMVDGGVHRLDDARLVEHLAGCEACSDVAARVTACRSELDGVPDPLQRGASKRSPSLDVPTVIIRQPGSPERVRSRVASAAHRALGAMVPPSALRFAWAAQLVGSACLAALLTQVLAGDPAPIEPTHDRALVERAAQAEKRSRDAEARAGELEREMAVVRGRIDELEGKAQKSADDGARSAAPGSSEPERGAPAPVSTASGEPPGFLTIVCNPFCDEVLDGAKSLGPSPIVHLSIAPGKHRVTLKRGGVPSKTITVDVASGQVTAQRVSMRGSADTGFELAPGRARVRELDRGAARAAITGLVQACTRGSDAAPGATGTVTATFQPDGEVSSVRVAPWGGSFGACITNAVRTVRTPRFDGDPVTVTVAVTVADGPDPSGARD